VYKLNGESPLVGMGAQHLMDGDIVNIYFTLDAGKDVLEKP
jgi:hypothetical protein